MTIICHKERKNEHFDLEDVTAFGDDVPDIGMLKLCGTGVAMGNVLDTVKKQRIL